MDRTETRSSTPRVVLSWLIVLIPLGWGVVQSVTKSVPLFRMATAAGTAASPSGK
ncbi:MFS transporter small subunit [Aquisphaera insulae]|uniref:MFS transporter small subunit n=1 Tax=Aquisphaera insulae TaxID=2712864 RepID=UPI0013ED6CBB|nr:hypothetical protein [Aquisphaera insulae]